MLKNILSLLLSKFYSNEESEAVGHQALPASSYTTLFTNKTITSWGAVASGVAANDGYLKLQSKGSGRATASLSVMPPRLTYVIQYPFETAGSYAWVPIAKGETWEVQGSDSTSINLYLYKTIGGGYQTLKKLILQGGGLCLNSLSSSLRKSSLSVKRSGCSKTLSHLKGTQLLSQINDQVLHLLRILLRQTDCLGFVIKQVRGITLHCLAIATVTEVTQQDGNFLRLTDGQLKTHFMYLREKSSNLIQTTKRQVLPECGSTRRLNSAVGGASC